MAVRAHQDHRPHRFDFIKIRSGREATFWPMGLDPAATGDDRGAVVSRRFGDPRLEILDRGRAFKVQRAFAFAHPDDMGMGVGEAGKERCAIQVHRARVIAHIGLAIGQAADKDDPPVIHRNQLGGGLAFNAGIDRTAGEDGVCGVQAGGLIDRLRIKAAGQRQSAGAQRKHGEC